MCVCVFWNAAFSIIANWTVPFRESAKDDTYDKQLNSYSRKSDTIRQRVINTDFILFVNII